MTTCFRRYFNTIHEVGYRLNTLSFGNNGNPIWTLECPKPFIPIAWLDGDGQPHQIPLSSLANQVLYGNPLEFLGQAFVRANAIASDLFTGVYYTEINAFNPTAADFGNGFANYMAKYLGTDPTFSTGQALFNMPSLLYPMSMIRDFWNEENSIVPAPVTIERDLLNFLTTFKQIVNPNFFIPPGSYNVDSTEGTYGPLTAVGAALNGGGPPTMLVLELVNIGS